MNAFLLSLTAALILVISALFAAPLFIDWNDYRPVFETQASKLLGRDVKVGGEVHLVLLPAPELRFDDVKVADEHGGFEQPLLEAKSIEAWLNVGALFTGVVEARKIAISDPVLRLALKPDGTGNWVDVGRPGEALPLAPKDVLLDDVSVSGGRVELARPGEPTLVVDGIEGVASAASLSGPYKVSASYRYDGRPQDLRFATGTATEAGSFHVKSVLRDPERGGTYLLEGDVTGLNAKPAYAGAVVYRLAKNLPADPAGAAPAGEAPPQADQPLPQDPPAGAANGLGEEDVVLQGPALSALELKGELDATPERAELPSFELAIHAKGRSQILKGNLAIDFGERPKVKGAVGARWIDADALLAVDAETKPSVAEALKALAERVLTEAAKVDEGAVTLNVEQLGIGGDLIGNVALDMTAKNGVVAIDRLSAALPGDNRLEGSGKLASASAGPVFQGPLKLEGSKLRTLTRWAAGDRDLSGQPAMGAFSLKADASLSGGGFALENASGELSGTKFSGTLRYQGGERRLVDLTLDSDRLDLREVLGDDVAWRSWLPAKAGSPDAAAEPEQNLLAALRDDEIDARLRVGELLLPNIPPGRLDAKFALAKDSLDIESLDFAAEGAIALRGSGRIDGLSDAPSGKVDLTLQAATPAGLRVAGELLGVPHDVAKSKHLAALTPLDVVASLTAARDGARTDATAEVKGKAAGADLTVLFKARGEPEKFAEAEIDLDAAIDGERPEAVLGLLIPGFAASQLAATSAGPGKLALQAKGALASNVSGRVEIATASLQAGFEGQGSLKPDGLTLSGQTFAKSTNSGLALMMLGLEASPAASGVPLDLRAEMAKAGKGLTLTAVSGTIDGVAVEGNARFTLGDDKTRFALDAKAASMSLAPLLGSLIAWQQTPATEDVLGAIVQGASDVWPARSFALSPLAGAEGEIKLVADKLILGAPFVVDEAVLLAHVDGDGLKITDLQGRLFGGTLAASGALSPRGTGAELAARATLSGGELAQLTQNLAGRVLAKGPFSLSFDVTGEGLTPPGVVAGLNGAGKLQLDAGVLQALTPLPLRRVAAEAGRKKMKLDKAQVEAQAKALREGITRGTYEYAAAELPFEVKNGTLRLQPAPLANKRADTTINGYIELASLKLDSEWVMRLTGEPNTDVPPVTLVFAGPLSQASEIAPAVDTAPIESFLTMRRMQDDVEQLETLDVSGRKPAGAEPADQQTGPDAVDAIAAEQAAEAKRLAEEKAAAEKAAEEKRLAEEKAAAEKAAEERRLAEEKAAAEKAAEEKRLAEEKAAAEKAAEEKRLAEEKAAAEKAAEEKRLAEEKAAAEKAAEEKRLAEEKAAAEKAAEEKRLAEEKAAAEKAAEEKRLAEEKAAAEKAAEEKRLAEERRKAEEARAAEARAAAEKAAEEKRLAEEKRQAEEQAAAEARAAAEKAAEERRLAEEKRLEEEKAAAEARAAAEKAAEERRLAEEKAAEERRLAGEKAAAEKAAAEKRLAEEKAAAEAAAAEAARKAKAEAEQAAAEARAAALKEAEQREAARAAAEQRAEDAAMQAPAAPVSEAVATPALAPAPGSAEQLPWLRGAAPLAGTAPSPEAALPDGIPPVAATPPGEAGLPTVTPEEAVPPMPLRAEDAAPAPRRLRKPVQREAPDDWKKGISIFGGG